jgi:hypothetical protein
MLADDGRLPGVLGFELKLRECVGRLIMNCASLPVTPELLTSPILYCAFNDGSNDAPMVRPLR